MIRKIKYFDPFYVKISNEIKVVYLGDDKFINLLYVIRRQYYEPEQNHKIF